MRSSLVMENFAPTPEKKKNTAFHLVSEQALLLYLIPHKELQITISCHICVNTASRLLCVTQESRTGLSGMETCVTTKKGMFLPQGLERQPTSCEVWYKYANRLPDASMWIPAPCPSYPWYKQTTWKQAFLTCLAVCSAQDEKIYNSRMQS